MKSPCTKVCVMDTDDRYCLGCRRTLGEIARWGQMSETEQAGVLAALPGRTLSDADRENVRNVTDRLHS
jgi:predicted Fe-S protein YdhL (DUF1289 family)